MRGLKQQRGRAYQIRVCHVGIHVDVSSMISCWAPRAFTFQCEMKLHGPGVFNQREVLSNNGEGPIKSQFAM